MTDTTPVSRRPGRGPWYCGACNGPLWRPEGCRICWLMTVRTMDGTDGRNAWATDPPVRTPSVLVAAAASAFNRTDDTLATSWWLPPGAVRRAGLWDRHRVRALDDRSYAVWLSVYAIHPRDLDLIRAALTSVETTARQEAL